MTDQINMIYSFYCYLLAQNFVIFNSWHMPFSNVPYSSFQKSETLEAFFLYQVFFHRHWQFTGQQGKGGDHLLFHSTTSTCSRTLRHLFATLHVRWLSRIFNCNACIYQTATQWDLPPYSITIWLIVWWCNVCLFTWWIDSRF